MLYPARLSLGLRHTQIFKISHYLLLIYMAMWLIWMQNTSEKPFNLCTFPNILVASTCKGGNLLSIISP